MDAFRPILLLTLSSLIPALSGSASSNDTLVVDIGDQFELLKLEVDEGQTGQQRWPPKHGFECDFDARSKGLSLWDPERQVAGTIRCRALGPQNARLNAYPRWLPRLAMRKSPSKWMR